MIRPVAAALLHSTAIWTTGTAGEARHDGTGMDGRATRAAAEDNENNYAVRRRSRCRDNRRICACARVLVASGATRVGSPLLAGQ